MDQVAELGRGEVQTCKSLKKRQWAGSYRKDGRKKNKSIFDTQHKET